MKNARTFSHLLTNWYNPNDRILPWKGIKDPYKIWISEIILQQTRAEQATPYYHNFINRFPTVESLAESSQETVLKEWEGLGYYSRARNLHAAAKQIVSSHGGKLPESYDQLLGLKGIGPYTAAAIASFAFGLAYPVLDGNVFRVLSRYFDIDHPTNESSSRKVFTKFLDTVFDSSQPALFNQAIMDFGATICKPKNPLCLECPLRKSCKAFHLDLINSRPIKKRGKKKRHRHFHYFLIQAKEEFLIKQRIEKDIWQGLYEFPLIEFDQESNEETVITRFSEFDLRNYTTPVLIDSKVSVLSHQKILSSFWQSRLDKKSSVKDWIWVNKKDLRKLAFPKVFDLFFKQISLI